MALDSLPVAAERPAAGFAATLLPLASLVVAALLSLMPLDLPGGLALGPGLLLIVTYRWALYGPDLLPPVTVFAVAVFYDLLAGGLPGVTALLLLLCRGLAMPQRQHVVERSFLFVWAAFAATVALTFAFGWALTVLVAVRFIEIRDTIIGALLTIALFPAASLLLGRAQRALLGRL